MGFIDLTGELLGKIDFEQSEIIQPQKLVFVCGGKASGNKSAPTSLRELLLNQVSSDGTDDKLAGAAVLLAEEADKELATSHFNNLLDLEEYIAAVVNAVVLIVESPGSFCELGAFVKVPEISEKLIAIVASEYHNKPSFITNGALKYLAFDHGSTGILSFDWNVDVSGVVSAPAYALSEMKKAIPASIQELGKTHASEKFDRTKKGHLIYLILSFCHIIRAAKLKDIKRLFEFASIPIDELDIEKSIDTLTICKLLKPVKNGKLTYYVAKADRIPLKIRWKDPKAKDRNIIRWISRIAKMIGEEEDEKFRLEIFKGHSNG